MRRVIAGVFAAGTAALCAAALVYGAERVLMSRTGHSWLLVGWNDLGPTIHDPLLGWTSDPSTDWPELYGPGGGCSFNARGFRATVEHEDRKPPGTTRVLFLGDSFTDGLGVGDDDTYPAQLERLVPGVQAVNLGKISYGIDQAVLRYERDTKGMEADWAVLASIDDNLTRARWDRFGGYWPKPRFRAAHDGDLRLEGTPVPDFSAPVRGPIAFAERSALWLIPRQYALEMIQDQDDISLAHGILDRFLDTASGRGQRAALIYLPTLGEARSGARLGFAGVLEAYASERDAPYLDLTSVFAAAPDVEALFLPNEHYSPAGCRLAAEQLAALLELSP